ncbi:MAG: molybdopterin-guanine dinucleotide biosynthesis protein MobB [Dehalococcoidia bacterium]|nr:molybdopterin-guanine dinucleotide biosynthesis protein MobB [Dehalococcoidia bacterium]
MTGTVPHDSDGRVVNAADLRRLIGPQVVCVRGPSRSGKTTMCQLLIGALAERGVKAAYLKRTHHLLDLPEKSSGRIWANGPTAMVLRATDRLQVTLPPGEGTAADLLAHVPGDADIVLLETHEPEPYPTILSRLLEPSQEAPVIGSWDLETIEAAAASFVPSLLALLPPDRELDRSLRIALEFHGGHGCPGVVLGTRLALLGGQELGLPLPDRQKRLSVAVESDRCAADAIQAVTGCRVGKRTCRVIDHGKLAARFLDASTGRAIRVAARSGTRAIAEQRYPDMDRHDAQLRAYIELPPETLFSVAPIAWEQGEFDLPGKPQRRIECASCGEEVIDARDVPGPGGPLCRLCASLE